MSHQLERSISQEMFDIAAGTGEEIINAKHLIAVAQ
jgi:hypothetical protein